MRCLGDISRRCRVFLRLGACLAITCPAAMAQPDARLRAPAHRDARIAAALGLLPEPLRWPVVVSALSDLPPEMRKTAAGACAFTTTSRSRIYVMRHCPTYQHADRSLWGAFALAALLRHEAAHLEGADEAQARETEARVFLEMARRGPPELLSSAAVHAARLRDPR